MTTNILKREKKEMHKMKAIHIFLIVVFNFIMGTTLATAQSYGLYTSDQINKTKEAVRNGVEPQATAYQKLMNLTDVALTKSHRAVASLKSYQFYGATAEQLAQMNLEQSYLANDANYAHQLGLAYRLTGDTRYAEKAKYFINAWASINKDYIGVGYVRHTGPVVYTEPNYYNQSNADMIMATSGLGFIQGAILIKDYTGWSNADRAVFNTWCTNVYRRSTDYMLQDAGWIKGNVGVTIRLGIIIHHVWQGDTSVIVNEDIPFVKNMLNLQLETLTDANYNIPDMFPVEVRRGEKGMWYTAWTLASFTASMEVIQNHTGVNLFRWNNSQGSNIEKALDRFFIYTSNPSSWPWLDKSGNTTGTITRIPQPGAWGGTLYEAMGIKFNKPAWKAWAGGPSAWFTTQLSWDIPALLQPNSIDAVLSEVESPVPPKAAETGAFIMDREGLH